MKIFQNKAPIQHILLNELIFENYDVDFATINWIYEF